MSKKMIIFIAIIVVLAGLVFWFAQAPKRSGLENGTKITLTSEDVVIHATLNNTKAAKSFASQLPKEISFGKSGVDFCATMTTIETDLSERQYGWHKGDISYVGGWLSIFYKGQNRLPIKMMVIGSINEEDFETLIDLEGSVVFKVDIAKNNLE